MKSPLVSIQMPAYNNPDYTRKALDSIVKQKYRPLDVFLSDDCSPISLEPLFHEFEKHNGNGFNIRYHRNNENAFQTRRGTPHESFVFNNAIGKYYLHMPHDDWFIDEDFISEAVQMMEAHEDCNLCVANSVMEHPKDQKMVSLPKKWNADEQWQVIQGDEYISLFGYTASGKGIGYQAWSGIVFDYSKAKEMGAFNYPYHASMELCEKLGLIAIDEGFVVQFLLSSIGDVAITGKVVSVRGTPKTSFCKTHENKWNDESGMALFYGYYGVYSAELDGKYAKAVKNRIKKEILKHPIKRINVELLRHFNFSFFAVYLYFTNYIVTKLRIISILVRLIKVPAYFSKGFR